MQRGLGLWLPVSVLRQQEARTRAGRGAPLRTVHCPAVAANTPPVLFYAMVLTHQTPTQVVITASNCCGTNETRLPYGELGNIRIASCCSCWAILSGHNLVGHKGQIAPGCFGCCQYGFLTQVHTELRTRMRARGDQVLLVVLAS